MGLNTHKKEKADAVALQRWRCLLTHLFSCGRPMFCLNQTYYKKMSDARKARRSAFSKSKRGGRGGGRGRGRGRGGGGGRGNKRKYGGDDGPKAKRSRDD